MRKNRLKQFSRLHDVLIKRHEGGIAAPISRAILRGKCCMILLEGGAN